MGANNEKSSESDSNSILDKYKVIKKFNDTKYGESTLLEDKLSKEECILRELNSTDEEEYNKSLKKYESRHKLSHPNIVQLIGFTYKTESQFCSTFYKIYLLYEHVTMTLEKQIQFNVQQKTPFTDDQLQLLLSQTIRGLAFLQKNNIQHQNLKPSTIFISKNGYVKVADPNVFNTMNSFATVITNPAHVQKSIYLSPILVKALEQSNWHPDHDPYKSDVFSLAMVFLHCALLDSCDNCYNYATSQFYYEVLDQKLQDLKSKYSPDLCSYLQLMLRLQENERPDFLQLEEMIQNNQIQDSPQKDEENLNERPIESDISNNKVQSTNENVVIVEQVKRSAQTRESQQQPQTNSQQNIQQSREFLSDISKSTLNKNLPEVTVNSSVTNAPQSYKGQVGQTAQGLQKDNIDAGSTIRCIPKETTAKLSKPDENQGNELGRGTHRDENPQQQQEQMEQQQYNENYQQELNFAPSQNNYYEEVQQQQKQQQQQQQQSVNQYTQQQPQSEIPTVQANYNPHQFQDVDDILKKYEVQIQQQNQQSKSELPKQSEPTQVNKQSFDYKTFEPQNVPQQVNTDYQFQDYNKQQTDYILKELQNPLGQQNLTSQPGSVPIQEQQIKQTTYTPIVPSIVPQNQQQTYPNLVTNNALLGKQPYQDYYNPQIQQTTTYQLPSVNTNLPPSQTSYYKSFQSNVNQVTGQSPVFTPITSQTTTNQAATVQGSQDYSILNKYLQRAGDNQKPAVEQDFAKNYNKYQDYKPSNDYLKDFKIDDLKPKTEVTSNYQLNNPSADIGISKQIDYYNQPAYDIKHNYDFTKDYKAQNNSDLPNNLQATDFSQKVQIPNSNTYVNEYRKDGITNYDQFQIKDSGKSDYLSNYYQQQPQSNFGQFGQQQAPFGSSYLPPSAYQDKFLPQQREVVIENYQNGSRYEGEKLNGMRHGNGKFFYTDGGMYDGEWKENKMHGKGVLSYACGKTAYDGDWFEDKFEGFGVLYNENPAPLNGSFEFRDFDLVEEYWTKYNGQFKDDNKEGYGTLYLSNGEKFSGTFKKDFVNGSGTFTRLDNTIFHGIWINNKLTG